MYKVLGVIAGITLFGGCASNSDAKVSKTQEIRGHTFALTVSLTQCADFLETGSYDARALSAVGLKEHNQVFGGGKAYRRPQNQGEMLTLSMRDAMGGNKPAFCSIRTNHYSAATALKRAGFDVARSQQRDVTITRKGVDFTLNGSYMEVIATGQADGPLYLNIELAKS